MNLHFRTIPPALRRHRQFSDLLSLTLLNYYIISLLSGIIFRAVFRSVIVRFVHLLLMKKFQRDIIIKTIFWKNNVFWMKKTENYKNLEKTLEGRNNEDRKNTKKYGTSWKFRQNKVEMVPQKVAPYNCCLSCDSACCIGICNSLYSTAGNTDRFRTRNTFRRTDTGSTERSNESAWSI